VGSFADNPFAVLTVIVAPAILTNAATVLSLGTGNRMARVVDRSRVLAAELLTLASDAPRANAIAMQLGQLRARARLLLLALRCFYLSMSAFAAAALIAIVGTVAAPRIPEIFSLSGILALSAGLTGVGGLMVGGILMVRETQLAVVFLEREAEILGLTSRR
jgi:hypothetical protein